METKQKKTKGETPKKTPNKKIRKITKYKNNSTQVNNGKSVWLFQADNSTWNAEQGEAHGFV